MKKQHTTRTFFVFALLAIIITSCYPSKRVTTGILTPAEALRQMYGREAQFIENDKVSLISSQGNAYVMNVNFLGCYWENIERERCAVIADSTNFCVSCGARIDAAVFEKTDTGWLLHSFGENIVNVQAAYAPKSELIQIGNGKYAVLATGTYASQGYESKHIAILAEIGEFFGSVLELVASENYETLDNAGNTFKWGYVISLDFYALEKEDYYGLKVKYSGNNQYGEMPKYQTYTLAGTKYVLAHEEK